MKLNEILNKYDEDDIYSVRKWHKRVRLAYPGVKIWKDERHHRFIASIPDKDNKVVGMYDYQTGTARIYKQ